MSEDNQDEWVTVTWGEEKFSLTGTYSSFSVGQLSMRTKVKPGEEPGEAVARAYKVLEASARAIYVRKRDSFLKALAGVEAAAKGGRP